MHYTYDASKGLVVAIVPVQNEYGNGYEIFYDNASSERVYNRLSYVVDVYMRYWGQVLRSYVYDDGKSYSFLQNAFVANFKQTFVPIKVKANAAPGEITKGLFCLEALTQPNMPLKARLDEIVCNNVSFSVYTTMYTFSVKCKQAEMERHAYNKLLHTLDPSRLVKDDVLDSLIALRKKISLLEVIGCYKDICKPEDMAEV